MGQFVSVIDYDDAVNLTTFASALDYPSAFQSEGYTPHRHVFVPHIAVAAFAGTFTAYANEEAPWIDCASNTVQHYGVKTAWSGTSAVFLYDVRVRVIVQFRNVR